MGTPKYVCLDAFCNIARNLPEPLSNPIYLNIINTYLKGNLPEIDQETVDILKNYLSQRIKDEIVSRSQALVYEINDNVGSLNDSPLNRCLNKVDEHLNYALYLIRTNFCLDKIEKEFVNFRDLSALIELQKRYKNGEINQEELQTPYLKVDLNEHQKDIYTLMYNFLRGSCFFHYNQYNFLKHWVDKKRIENGLISGEQRLQEHNSKKIVSQSESDSLTVNPNSVIPKTPLKSLFKDPAKYDEVIQLMKSNLLITINFNGLKWNGIQSNRKYEVVAFCDELYSKGLLNNSVDDFGVMLPILKGTFIDFSLSDKTFRHKGIGVLRNSIFEPILSKI